MNERLIHNFNQVVDHDDVVYFLGDISFGHRKDTVPIVKRMHGYKILVPGNHDHVHPMYAQRSSKYQDHLELYFDSFHEIMIEDQCIVDGFRLNHFPYYSGPDYQGRDFSEWQPADDGTPLLCGHVHDEWTTRLTPRGTFMYNVGVDANMLYPISFDQIKRIYDDTM